MEGAFRTQFKECTAVFNNNAPQINEGLTSLNKCEELVIGLLERGLPIQDSEDFKAKRSEIERQFVPIKNGEEAAQKVIDQLSSTMAMVPTLVVALQQTHDETTRASLHLEIAEANRKLPKLTEMLNKIQGNKNSLVIETGELKTVWDCFCQVVDAEEWVLVGSDWRDQLKGRVHNKRLLNLIIQPPTVEQNSVWKSVENLFTTWFPSSRK